MESQTTVTTLGARDAKACRDLDEAALGGLWTLQQWTHELSEAQRICLGLFDGPHLLALACGWMVVDELHITAVAVAPERRRCGFGRVLLEALLQRAADDGDHQSHHTPELLALINANQNQRQFARLNNQLHYT